MSPRRIAQSTLHSCLILLAIQFAAACAASEPWPPTGAFPDTATVPLPRGFPELTRPATVYLSVDTEHTGANQSVAATSRFVFYEDGTFAWQAYALEGGRWEFKGRLTRADATFDLRFDYDGLGFPWAATGTLRGDTLSVSYNFAAGMSGFDDGNYVRAP